MQRFQIIWTWWQIDWRFFVEDIFVNKSILSLAMWEVAPSSNILSSSDGIDNYWKLQVNLHTEQSLVFMRSWVGTIGNFRDFLSIIQYLDYVQKEKPELI